MKNILLRSAAGLALSTTLQVWGAVIIFDNSSAMDWTFNQGGIGGTSGTFGDLVTAGGTERTVTDFVTTLYALDRTANVSLSFYNPGVGNTVGTQIGATTSLSSHTFTEGYNTLAFSGLNITVPDEFIWAITIQYSVDWNHWPQTGGTPTIGSTDPDYAYIMTHLGAPAYTFGAGTGNMLATISAVPEPGATALFFGLFALSAGFITRRKSGQAGKPRPSCGILKQG